MGDNETTVKFGADTGQLKSGMSEATSAVKSATEHIAKSFDGMKAHVASQMTIIKELIVGALSVETFKSAIDGTLAYSESVLKLSRLMGSTTEEASVLTTALHMIGASTEDYSASVMKLNMHVKSNEERLNQLGVVTRDANSQTLSQKQIMDNTLATMMTYKEGTDRNLFSLEALGRGAATTAQFLKLTKERMEEAATFAKQFGIVLSKDAALQAEEFGVKLNTANWVLDILKIKIGNQLLPELLRLAGWFMEVGPPTIDATVTAVKVMIQIFEGLILIVRDVWNVCEIVFTAIGKLVALTAAAVVAAASGRFGEAWEIIKIGSKDAADTTKAQLDRMVLYHEAAQKRVSQMWKPVPVPTIKDPVQQGTRTMPPPDTKPFDQWKKELQKMQDDEQSFLGLSKASELDFWTAKLALTKNGSDEYLAVYHEIAALKKGIAKDEYETGQALLKLELAETETGSLARIEAEKRIAAEVAQVHGATSHQAIAALKAVEQAERDYETAVREVLNKIAEGEKAHAHATIALKEEEVKTKRALGQISATYETILLTELEDDRYALEKAALDTELRNNETRWKDYQQTLIKIQALEDQHRLAVKKLQDDERKTQMATIKEWLSIVTQAVDRSVLGMIQGTLTLQQALRNIFQSILAEFVNKLINKMVGQWLAGEIDKLNFSKLYAQLMIALGWETAVQEGAVQQAARTTNAVTQGASALGVSQIDAQLVFAGVFANLAPSMGPLAAGPAGASMAEVLAQTAAGISAGTAVASAARGFDIPVGVNPIVQTHAREMILPADLADNVRAMTSGGGGDTHIHINAVDAKSFVGMLKDSKSELFKILTQGHRDFQLRTMP